VKKVPRLLWIALAGLALLVVVKIVAIRFAGPTVLIDAFLNAALLAGLYYGHRLAYVATIVFILVATALAFAWSNAYGFTVFGLNALVLFPVLFSSGYFFPPPSGKDDEPGTA